MQFGEGKEIWIDQARAIAIICMVLCHTNDIMGCNFVFYKWVGISLCHCSFLSQVV